MDFTNGESPAAPFLDDCISTHNQEIYYGLTKREHLASLAPDNIPQWFMQVFSNTADDKLTWHRESNDFQIGECGFTTEGEMALYFAWRTYYADALLKELSK